MPRVDLDDRIRQRLAAFPRDHQRKAITVLLQKRRRSSEDRHPLMGWQPAVAVGEGFRRDTELAVERSGIVGWDFRDQFAIEGLVDLQGKRHLSPPG